MIKIKKILCITNLSDTSKNAEIAALRLSNLLLADLTVLSCGEYYSHIPNQYFNANLIEPHKDSASTEEYLQFVNQKTAETINHFQEISQKCGVLLPNHLEYEVKLENEVTATLDTLDERKEQFDLIIVEKQYASFWERLLFGSPAKEIYHSAHLSTLLMPPGGHWENWLPTSIVVGTTMTKQSEMAEEYGAVLASAAGGEITLVHATDPANSPFATNISHIFPIDYLPSQIATEAMESIKKTKTAELTKIAQKLSEKIEISYISSLIQFGRVGDSIINYLNDDPKKNLLVIGSKGENALKKFFLGSKTDAIEEACTIPLLVVQQQVSTHAQS